MVDIRSQKTGKTGCAQAHKTRSEPCPISKKYGKIVRFSNFLEKRDKHWNQSEHRWDKSGVIFFHLRSSAKINRLICENYLAGHVCARRHRSGENKKKGVKIIGKTVQQEISSENRVKFRRAAPQVRKIKRTRNLKETGKPDRERENWRTKKKPKCD